MIKCVRGQCTRADCRTVCGYSDAALAQMCDKGAIIFADGNHDTIHFNLYDKHEWDFVTEYMSKNHPTIPFIRTRLFN